MKGKKLALISDDGTVEIINNGLKENEIVKVTKDLSPSQINRINELTDFKKFTKEMGGFIHLIYVKSELLFKDIIDGATISRFLYLATYIDWNNKEENVLKMDSGEYMTKRDMCYILKISNDTFKRMYKELLDNNLIFEANDKIYISNEYISKGKINLIGTGYSNKGYFNNLSIVLDNKDISSFKVSFIYEDEYEGNETYAYRCYKETI